MTTNISLYGSSIFKRWENVITDLNYFTICTNKGVDGSTTSDQIELLKIDNVSHYDYILYYSGSNDVCRNIQPEVILQNFITFVNLASKKTKIIFFIGIMVCPSKKIISNYINYTNKIISEWCDVSNNACFIPVDKIQNNNIYTHDQLHLTVEGYKTLAKCIKHEMINIIQKQNFNKSFMNGSYYSKINQLKQWCVEDNMNYLDENTKLCEKDLDIAQLLCDIGKLNKTQFDFFHLITF